MTKSLRKIQSQINKKRGGSSQPLIEGSRDARRLRKGLLRREKLDKSSSARTKALQPKVSRFQYFQNIAISNGAGHQYAATEFVEHIERLLAELKAELDELEAARRPGRPPSNREDLLKNTLHRERDEFKTGYEIPNLLDEDNLGTLSSWNGGVPGLSHIKTIRVTCDGAILLA